MLRRDKWHFQYQHFGTTRGLCECKSVYILSGKSVPITCTELLDHSYMQLKTGTPRYTLRTQLFNYSIRWQYQQGISDDLHINIDGSKEIATLSGRNVEYGEVFSTTVNI